MKRCFKCGRRKDIKQFYKHPEMGDGHLGKCKSCTKKDASQRYYSPEGNARIREYERSRFRTPERKKKAAEYAKRSRQRHKGKARTRQRTLRAVKKWTLIKLPCIVCNNPNVEAHHTDYRKPLLVTWLCRNHHMKVEGKASWV